MHDCEVAVLARAPVPGQAKTRLIPRLGAERAAALQAHLTERALERAHAAHARIVLWIAGAIDAAAEQRARRFGAELRSQPDSDLGARMLAAVRHAHAAGRRALVIGTDCPAQQPQDLQQAGAWLADCDVVLQPALDGGYVLIGMNRPHAELFSDVPWGSTTVLALTRQRCIEHTLRVAELPARPDLDRPEDLDAALACGLLERARWA